MFRNKLYIFILLFVFWGCKSNLSIIETYSIKNLKEPVSTGIFYNLPKTEVIINVNVLKIIKKKGPFSDYSQKYLGALTNIIDKDKVIWKISDIEFRTIPIADTSNIFVVCKAKNISYLPFTLSKEGFLVSYNLGDKKFKIPKNEEPSKEGNERKNKNFSFELLPSDNNYKVVYDTVYREKIEDTVIKKIPVLKRTLVKKTLDEQAKEQADKLFTLREDRAALLVGEGDNDYLPTGSALRLMLSEIDKLESSYLSMFTGKEDTVEYTFSFSYIPSRKDIGREIILFKFSENSGVLPFDNIYGTPVSLEIATDNYAQDINKFVLSQKKQDNREQKGDIAGLYYRIPQKVKIEVKQDNQILSKEGIYINQLGTIAELPEELFGNEKLKIEFYPQLGAIKSISY